MIWTTIEIMAILVECFMVTRLMIRYFGLKTEKKQLLKWCSLFAMLSVLNILGTFFIKQESFLIIGCLLIEITFALLFLKGHLLEKLFLSAISYTLFYFINLPILNLIGLLTETDAAAMVYAQNSGRVICLFTTKVLYFAATQLILWIRKKETYHFKLNEWIVVVSAFFITLMIGFAMYMITAGSTISDYICMAVALLLSSLDIIVFVFMRKMNLSSRKEAEQRLLQFQLEQQQSDIHRLDQQYQELSMIRHDFKNRLDCIYTLMQQENHPEAMKYVQTLMEREIGSILPYIQCSSSVINAVVNAKFSEAEKYNIETSCRMIVEMPKYLEFDMSILLSNLLDNAIEACQHNRIPSQIILSISDISGYYRIVVKNTIENSVLEKNAHLKTKKEDKLRHGWGLKLVRDITEMHQGTMDVYEKRGMFIVSIFLIKDENGNLGN